MRPLICGRWWMVSGAWSFRVVKMVSCLAEISEIFRIQKLQDWMFWQCVMNLKRTVLSEIQDFGWWLCCSQGKKRRLVDGWLLQMKTWELAQDNTIFAWFLCRWDAPLDGAQWSSLAVALPWCGFKKNGCCHTQLWGRPSWLHGESARKSRKGWMRMKMRRRRRRRKENHFPLRGERVWWNSWCQTLGWDHHVAKFRCGFLIFLLILAWFRVNV